MKGAKNGDKAISRHQQTQTAGETLVTAIEVIRLIEARSPSDAALSSDFAVGVAALVHAYTLRTVHRTSMQMPTVRRHTTKVLSRKQMEVARNASGGHRTPIKRKRKLSRKQLAACRANAVKARAARLANLRKAA